MEQKALQMGAAVLMLALLLRLLGNSGAGKEELGKTMIFLSSGRLVTETVPAQTEAPVENVEVAEEAAAVPVFGEKDLSYVQVNGEWAVDTAALLRQPLEWELKAEEPTVLILHSHGTESYTADGTYQETSPYRTLDTEHNMVSIGQRVAELLEAGEVRVIHDCTLHDYPAYNDAYGNARASMERYLQEYPSICLVLDLHRDAAQGADGTQKAEAVTLNGRSSGQLMLVMGSDKGSLPYPNWEKNLSLAVKLQAQLEQTYPGLCKPIKLVSYRYNQDLSSGALLVEVGTAGNTHAQALAAAEFLAEGILALAKGANISG